MCFDKNIYLIYNVRIKILLIKDWRKKCILVMEFIGIVLLVTEE